MSHYIYHTEGLILGKIPTGESNYFLQIFTKDLGLIGALGQGIREIKSKLRYSLQTLSYASIDLVRGKEIWRVTNAEGIRSLSSLIHDKEKIALYARVAGLLKRLMPGEGPHTELFQEFLSAMVFLEKGEFDPESLKSLEALLVLRTLYHLGYWGEDERFKEFLKVRVWNQETLSGFSGMRKEAQKIINRSLAESHL